MCVNRRNWALRRLLAAVLCIGMAASIAIPVFAEDSLELASEAAILMDAQTGQVLYEKNGSQKMYPASITKIMTGYLALKYLEPQQVLTVSQKAVNAVPRSSSHISLEPGEQLTVEQAMYALAMVSANDAANVLAEAVSGNLSDFSQLMTEEAAALGARSTHFTNANGLPDSEHYTTAYDMALIASAALQQPEFNTYFSTAHFDSKPVTEHGEYRTFDNRNQILTGNYRFDGVLMSKTGWTSSAQGTLVVAAQRAGTTLIAVAMKSERTEAKYQDASKLLNYGFSHFSPVSITGEDIAQQLPLGLFQPMEDQIFPALIPDDADRSAIRFSLAEGTELSAVTGDRAEVTVNAVAGEKALPDIVLFLQKQLPDSRDLSEPLPAETAAVFSEALVETPRPIYRPWLFAAISVFVGITVISVYRQQSKRRHRRRNLANRIRRMKKQMEQ